MHSHLQALRMLKSRTNILNAMSCSKPMNPRSSDRYSTSILNKEYINYAMQAYQTMKVSIPHQVKKVAIKRKTKWTAASQMDYEQTMVPGYIYQSWLQDVSDLVSRRGRKRKVHLSLQHAILSLFHFMYW